MVEKLITDHYKSIVLLLSGKNEVSDRTKEYYKNTARRLLNANPHIDENTFNGYKKILLSDLLNSRTIRIDEEVFNLIEKTDNKKRIRKLPFSNLFIDLSCLGLPFIQGCLLTQIYHNTIFRDEDGKLKDGEPEISESRIVFIRYHPHHYDKENKRWIQEPKIEVEDLFKLDKSDTDSNRIKKFVWGVIDFINHPEVETKVVKWFNNQKRISRGQLPIPDRLNISIKGKLYRYIYEDMPKQEHSSPKNSFWVRGHYIHFWNQKRFNKLYNLEEEKLEKKGYYKDKQGVVSKWVLPYIKGRGKVKKKDYKLKRGGKR